jgi:CRISPR-associated protein Cas1
VNDLKTKLILLSLKKNLWQQTISSKITNQAGLLKERGIRVEKWNVG